MKDLRASSQSFIFGSSSFIPHPYRIATLIPSPYNFFVTSQRNSYLGSKHSIGGLTT